MFERRLWNNAVISLMLADIDYPLKIKPFTFVTKLNICTALIRNEIIITSYEFVAGCT